MTTPSHGWLSVPATARRLALSERQVWALVSEKRIASMLVDGRRLVDPAAITARANKRQQSSEVQWQLQSETLYQRVERLEKKMRHVLEELQNGRQ